MYWIIHCFFILVVLPLNYVDKQSIVVGFFPHYSIVNLVLSGDKVVQLCDVVELVFMPCNLLYVDALYY